MNRQLSRATILQMQRIQGNRATRAMLQRLNDDEERFDDANGIPNFQAVDVDDIQRIPDVQRQATANASATRQQMQVQSSASMQNMRQQWQQLQQTTAASADALDMQSKADIRQLRGDAQKIGQGVQAYNAQAVQVHVTQLQARAIAAQKRTRDRTAALMTNTQTQWKSLQSTHVASTKQIDQQVTRTTSTAAHSKPQSLWQRFKGGVAAAGRFVARGASYVTQGIMSFAGRIRRRIGMMWQSMQRSFSRLKEWAKRRVNALLGRMKQLWSYIKQFNPARLIKILKKFGGMLRALQVAVQDPTAANKPIIDRIQEKLEAQLPQAAMQKAGELMQNGSSVPQPSVPQQSPGKGGMVQRYMTTLPQGLVAELRDPVPSSTIIFTIMPHLIKNNAAQLWGNLWHVIKDAVFTFFWPWPAVGRELSGIGSDMGRIFTRLTTPGMGFLRHLLDVPILLMKRINAIAMHLAGWFTMGVTILGAAAGGLIGSLLGPAGTALGAISGAGAGLGLAAGVGEALLAVYVGTEAASFLKAWTDLSTQRQTKAEQAEDLNTMSNNALGIGITVVMLAVPYLGAGIARKFSKQIAGRLANMPRTMAFLEGMQSGFDAGAINRRLWQGAKQRIGNARDALSNKWSGVKQGITKFFSVGEDGKPLAIVPAKGIIKSVGPSKAGSTTTSTKPSGIPSGTPSSSSANPVSTTTGHGSSPPTKPPSRSGHGGSSSQPPRPTQTHDAAKKLVTTLETQIEALETQIQQESRLQFLRNRLAELGDADLTEICSILGRMPKSRLSREALQRRTLELLSKSMTDKQSQKILRFIPETGDTVTNPRLEQLRSQQNALRQQREAWQRYLDGTGKSPLEDQQLTMPNSQSHGNLDPARPMPIYHPTSTSPQSKPTRGMNHATDAPDLKQVGSTNYRAIDESLLQYPTKEQIGGGRKTVNRVEHVFLHGSDDVSKTLHGIFTGDGQSVVKLIESNFVQILKGEIKGVLNGEAMAFTIQLPEAIGVMGGSQSRGSVLNTLTLVIRFDGLKGPRSAQAPYFQVISAYPSGPFSTHSVGKLVPPPPTNAAKTASTSPTTLANLSRQQRQQIINAQNLMQSTTPIQSQPSGNIYELMLQLPNSDKRTVNNVIKAVNRIKDFKVPELK